MDRKRTSPWTDLATAGDAGSRMIDTGQVLAAAFAGLPGHHPEVRLEIEHLVDQPRGQGFHFPYFFFQSNNPIF